MLQTGKWFDCEETEVMVRGLYGLKELLEKHGRSNYRWAFTKKPAMPHEHHPQAELSQDVESLVVHHVNLTKS